jgi:hypothetical protein
LGVVKDFILRLACARTAHRLRHTHRHRVRQSSNTDDVTEAETEHLGSADDLARKQHFPRLAAVDIGENRTKFDGMMRDGRMRRPKHVDTIRVWDTRQLDVSFEHHFALVSEIDVVARVTLGIVVLAGPASSSLPMMAISAVALGAYTNAGGCPAASRWRCR